MTYINETRSIESGIFSSASQSIISAGTRFQQFRAYRRTVKELSALGDRELMDLGINRSMIHSIAIKAAYE